MRSLFQSGRLVWLGAGLLVGLLLSPYWPSTPLHAVATDRAESITIATGFVDNEVEAFFFLDSLTGTLRAAVPSNRAPQSPFQAMWECNLNADLAGVITRLNAALRAQTGGKRGGVVQPEIQFPQPPKYMMVTGALDLRQGAARVRPSRSLVYVAEANTGVILGYALPWSENDHAQNRPLRQPMMLWVADRIPMAVVRPEE